MEWPKLETRVKEKSIIFNSVMVRAILDGRKTQTRRVIKRQPPNGDLRIGLYHPTILLKNGEEAAGKETFGAYDIHGEWGCRCPFGQPGDRLWVREAHAFITDHRFMLSTPGVWKGEDHGIYSEFSTNGLFKTFYRASPLEPASGEWEGGWRPSIHMPRWASRITLEITGVRVERLQEISEEDAKAEGIEGPFDVGYRAYSVPGDSKPRYSNAVAAFSALWSAIYGPFPWELNEWVWVISFKRLT